MPCAEAHEKQEWRPLRPFWRALTPHPQRRGGAARGEKEAAVKEFAGGKQPTVVFSDGACSGNPGRGGFGVIVVRPDGEVSEHGAHEPLTTNNRMELAGSIIGLEVLHDVPGPVLLYTDSTYVIRGITQWIHGWRRRGWKTAEGADVTNRDLWERLARVAHARKGDDAVDWRYVRGHAGVPGNERVDEIAVGFSKNERVRLYRGPLSGYGVAVLDLPESHELPPMQEKKAKTAAFSYLSLVDGKVERHATWAECEGRVKGRSGAKFKKATSEADEAAILASWGVRR
jgi:ribonuclease HI